MITIIRHTYKQVRKEKNYLCLILHCQSHALCVVSVILNTQLRMNRSRWRAGLGIVGLLIPQAIVVAIVCTFITYSFLNNTPADNTRKVSCDDLEGLNTLFLFSILGTALFINGTYPMQRRCFSQHMHNCLNY